MRGAIVVVVGLVLNLGCSSNTDDETATGTDEQGSSSTEGADGTDGNTCEEGRTLCDGECVDLDRDTRNCGECGQSCGTGYVCCIGGFCYGGAHTCP
jgi:hypothetical protein